MKDNLKSTEVNTFHVRCKNFITVISDSRSLLLVLDGMIPTSRRSCWMPRVAFSCWPLHCALAFHSTK